MYAFAQHILRSVAHFQFSRQFRLCLKCSQCRPVNNYISNITKCLQDNTPDPASRMSPFAEATKKNGVRKCRGASDSEEKEDLSDERTE